METNIMVSLMAVALVTLVAVVAVVAVVVVVVAIIRYVFKYNKLVEPVVEKPEVVTEPGKKRIVKAWNIYKRRTNMKTKFNGNAGLLESALSSLIEETMFPQFEETLAPVLDQLKVTDEKMDKGFAEARSANTAINKNMQDLSDTQEASVARLSK